MKTSELTENGVYAYSPQQLNQSPRPALVLATCAWMTGIDAGPSYGTQKVTIARAPRQNMRLTSLPYATPTATGIPVLVLNHSAYRWISTDPDERIDEPAPVILDRAAIHLGDLIGEYLVQPGQSLTSMFKTRVAARLANGRKTEVEAELMLVRTQNLVGDWLLALRKEVADRERDQATESQRLAAQTAADLLDRDIAATLDSLLADAHPRNPHTGLRSDVTRLRGAGEFQVSVETFLKVLELAKKGSP